MKLFEFFGTNSIKTSNIDKVSNKNLDELYQFILEHDKLYKEYVIPISKKIKKDKLDKINQIKEFMPMINKGCKEYYIKNKLPNKFENIFTQEIQEELCEKIYNHYHENIIKNNYKLGE